MRTALRSLACRQVVELAAAERTRAPGCEKADPLSSAGVNWREHEP